MHRNSYKLMRRFRDNYLDSTKELSILDVGSYDVNGTYKDLFDNSNWTYTGADIEKGNNVDIILKEKYNWEIEDNTYDVVISGQCLEHVEEPWETIREITRIMKPESFCCIIAPWKEGIHRYPIDCWRILPDGINYLFNKNNIEMLECDVNRNDTFYIGKNN